MSDRKMFTDKSAENIQYTFHPTYGENIRTNAS